MSTFFVSYSKTTRNYLWFPHRFAYSIRKICFAVSRILKYWRLDASTVGKLSLFSGIYRHLAVSREVIHAKVERDEGRKKGEEEFLFWNRACVRVQ